MQYDLPDIAEALQAGNWFDSRQAAEEDGGITVLDGFYSVETQWGICWPTRPAL